ncbi:helix-turn-helix domain-containing protein [Neisseria gonorrhoeae]|uniref:helix-turn-helix domain-containing protein n=1 Tax=Neisseria gonorrhoeae TaxID=485 RepID=UPI00387A8C1C
MCYPSQETLAEDTGFAETAVRQHIKWLKDNNFIKSARRQRGGRGSPTSTASTSPCLKNAMRRRQNGRRRGRQKCGRTIGLRTVGLRTVGF